MEPTLQSDWKCYSSDEWRRSDGVTAMKQGSGIRPWCVLRGTSEYLRGKLFADSDTPGGVRTFGRIGTAMLAADSAWPLTSPST